MKTRITLTGFVWALIAVIAFFYSHTGQQLTNWTHNTIQIATEKAHCELAQVKVIWNEDTHYTKAEEVLAAMNIQQGMKMSNIHLNQLRQDIEHLPWVRSAIVERLWPNNLRITITEKKPLALWQHNKQYQPLDEYAKVIPSTQKLPADLLLVVGTDAPKHLLSLLKDLEQFPTINQYVRAAVRIRGRRWNLKLFDAEKGVDVMLPETDIINALERLDMHNKKEQLIKRKVALIDLRTSDKVVVKPIEKTISKNKAGKK